MTATVIIEEDNIDVYVRRHRASRALYLSIADGVETDGRRRGGPPVHHPHLSDGPSATVVPVRQPAGTGTSLYAAMIAWG